MTSPNFSPSSISTGHKQSGEDRVALALNALVWTIAEPERGDRLLALTGLTPEALRSRLTDPSLLAAAIGFLEANEADLTACAQALGVAPITLVRAREALER